MKRPSKVNDFGVNEMPGSGGCLRQKKVIRLHKESHNFWIFEAKHYEETMANKQSQNETMGNQTDEVT